MKKDIVYIPLVVHELEMSRAERIIRRLLVVIMALIILLCGCVVVMVGNLHLASPDSRSTTATYVVQSTERDILWTNPESTRRISLGTSVLKPTMKRSWAV